MGHILTLDMPEIMMVLFFTGDLSFCLADWCSCLIAASATGSVPLSISSSVSEDDRALLTAVPRVEVCSETRRLGGLAWESTGFWVATERSENCRYTLQNNHIRSCPVGNIFHSECHLPLKSQQLYQCRTCAGSGSNESPWLAFHRSDSSDHRPTRHDGAVHLHPFAWGRGRRVPGPHLAGIQVGKLRQNKSLTVTLWQSWPRNIRHQKHSEAPPTMTDVSMYMSVSVWQQCILQKKKVLTSVVREPTAPSLVLSANVCCPLGCFFTRSKATETCPSKESTGKKNTHGSLTQRITR